MSFLDKLKEAADSANKTASKKYQEHQEKVSELKDARGAKIGALQLQYMGGYENKKKAIGILTFYEKQTEFNSPLSTKFTILNSSISNVVIEGKDEVNRRVTVTRLLLVGIFAFALKKKNKDKEAYVTIELSDGQEAIFFVDKKSPMELRTTFASTISRVKQAGKTNQNQLSNATKGSAADELIKLASLKDQGLLTQEEFDNEKSKLIGK